MLRPLFLRVIGFAAVLLLAALSTHAASLSGYARVEIQDPSGGLSWLSSNNAITVQCWFRISVPSGASISQNMTILVDRTTGTESDPYAYLIRFNTSNGNIEFLTKGTTTGSTNILIEKPYLDRWYHIAVVRSGSALDGIVDGRVAFSDTTPAGNGCANSNGVSMKGC